MGWHRNKLGIKSSGGGIPRNGLIAEYLFNGNADDTSGSGYDGTPVGATLTTGRKGAPNSAYSFGGTDRIDCQDIVELNLASEFSISCWIYQNTLDVKNWIWAKNLEEGSTSGSYTWIDGKMYQQTSLLSSNFDYSIHVSAITWHHFVFVFDGSLSVGSKHKTYIDNVEATLSDNTTSSTFYDKSGIPFTIGLLNSAVQSSNGWNGDIDDFRIYDKPLTSDERTLLFNE